MKLFAVATPLATLSRLWNLAFAIEIASSSRNVFGLRRSKHRVSFLQTAP
jgi:hypothetical protein